MGKPMRQTARKKRAPNTTSGKLIQASDLASVETPFNKKSLQDIAKPYAKVALATLAQICRRGDTDSARAAAAIALLDRGYGRPAQAMQVGGDPEGVPVQIEQVNRDADAFTSQLLSLIAKRSEGEAASGTRH